MNILLPAIGGLIVTGATYEPHPIQYHARLSEETNCYSAKLFMNGKHVADVSNRGQGGSDEQHWIDRDAEAKISAHFAALPEKEVTFGDSRFMVKPDLESWCGEERIRPVSAL